VGVRIPRGAPSFNSRENWYSRRSHKASSVGSFPTSATNFTGDVGIVVERHLAKVQAPFRLRYVAPILREGLMKDRISRLRLDPEFTTEFREILTMFADSILKLEADVAKLIAQNGPAAVATAVAAKDASDAAAVDAVDATVVAALPAATPVAPTV
jgi:hypothetical protein